MKNTTGIITAGITKYKPTVDNNYNTGTTDINTLADSGMPWLNIHCHTGTFGDYFKYNNQTSWLLDFTFVVDNHRINTPWN
jgi:hypothetical protein